MIHRIGDTYIRLDKIVAIRLNHIIGNGPTNIVKLILFDNIEDINIEFNDYAEAKDEVDELIQKLEEFYLDEKAR